MSRRYLGAWGEKIAAAHLKQRGYTILGRNWGCPHGEVDILAEHEGDLVIVEVRTRRGEGALELALESISAAKQRRLILLAQACHAALGREDLGLRIDVVVVRSSPPLAEIYRDAVQAG